MSWAQKTKEGIEKWFTTKPAPDKPSWGDKIKDWLAEPRLEKINEEISLASLDPTKFRTKEVKELAQQIKDNLAHSPHGIADWGQSIIGDFMTKIWDVAIGIMLPSKMDTFEEAKASATWLAALIADFVVLSAVLDIVGTAFSVTLIRNIVHICQLFAATFGIDRYLSATIAPALETSIIPRLTQGYNKQYQTVIPGIQDIIRMAVREAFTPEIAERFGQYQDFPEAIVEFGAKQGLSVEWLRRYWAAHWDLPSPQQGFEMLHRGIITEADLELLLRALDVMPFWRDKLTAISWNVPTRVDIRRFYAMGVINDTRLRELYTAFGYHGVDLENIVDYTIKSSKSATADEGKALTKAEIYKGVKQGKITREEASGLLVDLGYDADTADLLLATNIPEDNVDAVVKERELTKAEIVSGLKAAVITEDEAKAALIELRYSSDNADFLLQIYRATIRPPTEPKVKEASKADIVKAVKMGLITPEDGYLMLQDIGFTPEASQFILVVQAEASPFSPANFAEFKDLTQKYRTASGLGSAPVSEEIKKAAAELQRLTGEVGSLNRAIKEEKGGLVEAEVLPAEATARLTELQVKLHRAEAELARVKSDYNAKIAEWRHSQ